MPIYNDQHVFLGRLLMEARLKKGYKTVKNIYQHHKPTVDYQTWSKAESGRRIPHPNSLIEMAKILEIDKQDLLIAYTKDKFPDEESHQILNAFPISRFVDLESLLDAANHDSRLDVILNNDQIGEMTKDIRLRLFLLYTYDQDFKTTFSRLSAFFHYERTEVELVVNKLAVLGLVEIDGEEIRRLHEHTTMPSIPSTFELRRQILIKSLELNVKPNSFVANFHTFLSDDAYKKLMDLIYFARANIIRLEKEQKPVRKKRYQIALVANTIDEGIANEHVK